MFNDLEPNPPLCIGVSTCISDASKPNALGIFLLTTLTSLSCISSADSEWIVKKSVSVLGFVLNGDFPSFILWAFTIICELAACLNISVSLRVILESSVWEKSNIEISGVFAAEW